VTLGAESYLKVDTGATPNNCVNHKHELNQMIEQCDDSLSSVECQRDADTQNHNLLKFADRTKCKAAIVVLNKILVDVVPYAASDFGTLQCSSSGFLKDSTGGSPFAKCATTASALNRAIGLWQSGSYTNCDFTTDTTTATTTVTSKQNTVSTTPTSTVSSSATTSVTSTVTSTDHGKLACNKVDGTKYIQSTGDCESQLSVLNALIQKCDSAITTTASLQCVSLDGNDVLSIYSGGKGSACNKVATSMNTMAAAAKFGDSIASASDAAVSCTLEGYLIGSTTGCVGTVGLLNHAIEGYLAGEFLSANRLRKHQQQQVQSRPRLHHR
jgi:hypothetical protein